MPPLLLLLFLIGLSGATAVIGVGWTRRVALHQQMIDIPNERSSHTAPTPRGGGLSIVVIAIVGALLLALMELIPWSVALALLVGGGVAVIGYLDDRGGLSPLVRGLVHLGCAAAGLALIGGMPPLDLGFTIIEWGLIGQLVGVIGIVWLINLYNFMDGIDGLAGSEAVFVFGLTSALLLLTGGTGLPLLGALLIGGCLGFLRWNWPRAKIFMGDVASGFLGYAIAIAAIASAHAGFPLWVWLIAIGVFVVDATVTVIRRAARGEKWYQPHRSHAYQHLTTRWGSHRRVTLSIIALNLFWLTPLGLLVYLVPAWSLPVTLVALAPLVLLALRLGAGGSGRSAKPVTPQPLTTS